MTIITRNIKIVKAKEVIQNINWELIISQIKFRQISDFRNIKDDTFLCTWEVENLACESEAIIDKHCEL